MALTTSGDNQTVDLAVSNRLSQDLVVTNIHNGDCNDFTLQWAIVAGGNIAALTSGGLPDSCSSGGEFFVEFTQRRNLILFNVGVVLVKAFYYDSFNALVDEHTFYVTVINSTPQPSTETRTSTINNASSQTSTTAATTEPIAEETPKVEALLAKFKKVPCKLETQRIARDRFAVVCSKLIENASNESKLTKDLTERCNELIYSTNQDAVCNALSAIAHDEIAAQGRESVELSTNQFINIGARIAALRKGATRGGLLKVDLDINGHPIAPLLYANAAPQVTSDSGTEKIDPHLNRYGFFLNGGLNFGDRDNSGRESGFNYDTKGLTGGFDYMITEYFYLGTAFGYSRTDSDLQYSNDSIDTDGYMASLYGSFFGDDFFLDGIMNHGWLDKKMERNVAYTIDSLDADSPTLVEQNFKSDPDASELSFSLSGGYNVHLGGLTLGPYLRATKLEVDIDSYRERAAQFGTGSSLALLIDDQDVHSFTTALGGRAFYAISASWAILQPHLQFEWLHEYSNDSRHINARFLSDLSHTTFTLPTDRPDRDHFNVMAGLSAIFQGGYTSSFVYESALGFDKITSHKLVGTVRLEF
jgi:uncharacterized protein with beta-barrel porin domain